MSKFSKFIGWAGLSGLALAGTAQAQVYVQGYGGLSAGLDTDFNATISNVSAVNFTGSVADLDGQSISVDTNPDTGTIYGAAIGYNFDEILFGPFSPRVELDYSQIKSEISDVTLPSNSPIQLPENTQIAIADREIKTLAVRGILEWDTPIIPFDPYVGASVGISDIKNPLGAIGTTLNLTDTSVDNATTYGLFAGGTIALPLGAAVYGELRYSRTDDVTLDLTGAEFNAAAFGTSSLVTADLNASTNINTVSGLLGLRWEF